MSERTACSRSSYFGLAGAMTQICLFSHAMLLSSGYT
jgi:hypothetical protein